MNFVCCNGRILNVMNMYKNNILTTPQKLTNKTTTMLKYDDVAVITIALQFDKSKMLIHQTIERLEKLHIFTILSWAELSIMLWYLINLLTIPT